MLSLLFVMTANAQEYNLFPAADVDENGWLWFDTQAKIDKYVGLCNEDDYTVDPNGKIIQMVFANITPDYPETTADPDAYGVGTDAEFGSDGAKKGAIIIAIAKEMNLPVKLVGVGEKMEDLKAFVPEDFINALFE